MSNKKTRQRQDRDFSIHDYLRNTEMAVEGNYNMVGDGIINNAPPADGEEEKQLSFAERLELMKEYAAEQDAERGGPVDGHEPSPERGRW